MKIKTEKRWVIQTVFGRSLDDTVYFISIATSGIAAVSVSSSIYALIFFVTQKDLQFGNNPMLASTLIIVLVLIPMSLYQMVISLLFLYRIIKPDGNAFFCNLWFTSHIVICFIYALLYLLKIITSFCFKYYVIGVITLLSTLTYEGLFIFFIAVVNSFLELSDLSYF